MRRIAIGNARSNLALAFLCLEYSTCGMYHDDDDDEVKGFYTGINEAGSALRKGWYIYAWTSMFLLLLHLHGA